MAGRPLPPVDPALIEWLEVKYPNRVPPLEASSRQVGALVGQQEVISHIRGILAKTVKDNLGITD